jgi:mRNA interferase MazF
MEKGDIVLISFPFTNLKGAKRRPAVILYKGELDVIVSFITSRI